MSRTFLLAIESSGREASAAIAHAPGGRPAQVVAEQVLDPGQRTAVQLIPALRDLLAATNTKPVELLAIAVAIGPGSFTGLRIGITAAKTLAYATGAQLLGVSTLDVLARQASPPPSGNLWAILDAQRGDVFASSYASADLASMGTVDRTQLMAGSDWLAQLSPGDKVVGPVVHRYADQISDGVNLASDEQCRPQAHTIATWGFELIDRQLISDPFQMVPKYHRLSAAEEKARHR